MIKTKKTDPLFKPLKKLKTAVEVHYKEYLEYRDLNYLIFTNW